MSSNLTCPSVYNLPKCVIAKTYLRPGPGTTLMPWSLSAVLFVLHGAILATRITKWDKSLYLSLAMAAFSMFFTILAYKSTKLSSDSIYVWLPLTLAGDVGAVLQALALIYKDHWSQLLELRLIRGVYDWWPRLLRPSPTMSGRGANNRAWGTELRQLVPGANKSESFSATSANGVVDNTIPSPKDDRSTVETRTQNGFDLEANLQGDYFAAQFGSSFSSSNTESDVIYLKLRRAAPNGPSGTSDVTSLKVLLFLIITSWLLLIGLVVLQVIGLRFAVTGLQDTASSPPQKIWCSPGFQLAANPDNAAVSFSNIQPMVFDGSCESNYTVTINTQGTGCIAVTGDQPMWLKATAFAVGFQLLLQIIDVCLLFYYRNSPDRWVHMRPVCTMITGVIVWGFLTVAAGVQTKDFPLVSGVVAIIAPAQPDCKIQMDSAGLRGEIIAWSDSVFSALNSVYYGPFGYDSRVG